jgi:hypothetical protein
VIPVSMVVYWMMTFWLKEGDTCVNGGLLNDDILIKTKWYLCQWWIIEWWYFDYNKVIPDKCVNSGLLNDDILIKTKWYLENKTKWYLCQWWFIEW